MYPAHRFLVAGLEVGGLLRVLFLLFCVIQGLLPVLVPLALAERGGAQRALPMYLELERASGDTVSSSFFVRVYPAYEGSDIVAFEAVRSDREGNTLTGWVSAAALVRADRLLSDGAVWVVAENGGQLPGVVKRVVLMGNEQGFRVGLKVGFEDLGAPFTTHRQIFENVRLVSQDRVIRKLRPLDPVSAPVLHQLFLVGATTLDAQQVPAIPVVVLQADEKPGEPLHYLVMEVPHLIDPDLTTHRVYRVPAHILRRPLDSKEYQNQLFYYVTRGYDRARMRAGVRMRQRVLFPWTYRHVKVAPPEQGPIFQQDRERLSDRVQQVRAMLASENHSGEHESTGTQPLRCEDYLYSEGT